ncbi:DNA-J related domain-containing protein [Arhodomonas aquaeolei]|uniref:DNA-J related domain-containing protein n=1 Tax=Arhodomonas aquaeolei TaxID=2369 RepID=UPI00037E7852|nr:DNA-J related domain-containing protein [Arhodomonas aquaeolei]
MDNCETAPPAGAWDHHLGRIEAMLREAPEGLAEFELIRGLQARDDVPEIAPGCLARPLAMYRTHFLLFHTLYRLGERLAVHGEDVQVDCLCIRILPRTTASALGAPDGVRAFYTDMGNLDGITEAEVERLLGSFWQRLARDDGRADALAELGLSDPVDDAAIRAAYRRLAMRHHPDRGGDGGRLREINRAMRTLGLQ